MIILIDNGHGIEADFTFSASPPSIYHKEVDTSLSPGGRFVFFV